MYQFSDKCFNSILQFFGLCDTFWPSKSLALKCLLLFESEVLSKGPLDATGVVLKP